MQYGGESLVFLLVYQLLQHFDGQLGVKQLRVAQDERLPLKHADPEQANASIHVKTKYLHLRSLGAIAYGWAKTIGACNRFKLPGASY